MRGRRARRRRRACSAASIAARISERLAHAAGADIRRTAIAPSSGPTNSDAVAAQRRDIAPASPDAATCARSSPARPARACRWRAAASWRDRRRGRAPCAPADAAVAGATTTRSASRERRMWPISCSSVSENRSVNTRSPARLAKESGVTKRAAAAREDDAHARAALAQPADQLERLIGGDAAADDEQHGPASEDLVLDRDHRRLRSLAAPRRILSFRLARKGRSAGSPGLRRPPQHRLDLLLELVQREGLEQNLDIGLGPQTVQRPPGVSCDQ